MERIDEFLSDFFAAYHKVAEIVPWQGISHERAKECPFCPWDPVARDHRRDVRGASFEEVWSVTEHVFVKHGVKKPKMLACWSVRQLIDGIEFE